MAVRTALKANVKEQRKARRDAIVNPYKVGDILSVSWGYEQTNVDFYEVVRVTPKAIVIQQIRSKTVRDIAWAQGEVMPCPREYIGSEERKILQPYIDNDPDPYRRVHLHHPYGWLKLWDGSPQRASWYA
jgi:hypothetical protein